MLLWSRLETRGDLQLSHSCQYVGFATRKDGRQSSQKRKRTFGRAEAQMLMSSHGRVTGELTLKAVYGEQESGSWMMGKGDLSFECLTAETVIREMALSFKSKVSLGVKRTG